MLLMQIFLPRFLVLEVVLFFHFIQQGHCKQSKTQNDETNQDEDDCVLDLGKDLDKKFHPLLLHKNGSQFLLPQPANQQIGNSGTLLRVSKGDTLTASCPGTTIKSESIKKSLSFECLEDQQFLKENVLEVSNDDVITDLSCSKSIQESIVESNLKSATCGPPDAGAKMVQVGWPSEGKQSKVIAQYSVCHSKSLANTFYSSHSLYGLALASMTSTGPRPSSFKEGKGFYTVTSPSRDYSLKSQESTFTRLLGASSGGNFFNSKKFFLAKGHLSPDADFVYQEFQDASYYFFNVVPQWQSFNNGNWKSVETTVRKFAEANKKTLSIYTGTYGQLTLPNDQGNLVPIALAGSDNYIPVPEIIWKIVHDPNLNKALVFVGVNNPHTTARDVKDKNLILCPNESSDLCSDLGWDFKQRKDVSKGYLYCCSYQSVKDSIGWIPDLGSPLHLAFEDPTRRTSPRQRSRREDSDPSLCSIELKSESSLKWPPLFYDKNGKVIFPQRSFDSNETSSRNLILVQQTDNVTVACPGSRLKLNGRARAEFRCVNSLLLSAGSDNVVQYSELSCSKSIEEDLVPSNDTCGPPSDHPGKIVRIGWTLGESFQPMISLCHSSFDEHTHYAFHSIDGKFLSARENNQKRRSNFREGSGFYRRTVANSLYKLKNQEKLFAGNGLAQFFSRENNSVLTRGHLAPNGDFVYKEWQDATFYFLNVAPQWKKFNSGNWLSSELQVRHFAEEHEKSLNVFTGTHGTLTLPDTTGVLREVFLDKRSLIPVPLFYWKLVHDPEENKAIVFVGVNSPRLYEQIPEDLIICPDICETYHWNFPNKNVSEKGFLYCCSYQSFKQSLPWINFLSNPGILEK